MDDTQRMLQKIINGQSSLKQELLLKIDGLDKKLTLEINDLRKTTIEGFKRVNKRLDMQGKQLAFLDEDAPTSDEFRDLTKRVENLEQKFASV